MIVILLAFVSGILVFWVLISAIIVLEACPKYTIKIQISSVGGSGSEQSFSDSQEEDQHLWEEQQIGKGVKRHQVNIIVFIFIKLTCKIHNGPS